MNNKVKIPVESVLHRMSKFVLRMITSASYPKDAIARSVMQNCITMAAFMRLTVDGVDILNADDELRVVNAARSTKQYNAHVGPVYNAAEVLQIVHNNKVIFKYVDD